MRQFAVGHWPARTLTFNGEELKFLINLLIEYRSVIDKESEHIAVTGLITRLLTRDDEKI